MDFLEQDLLVGSRRKGQNLESDLLFCLQDVTTFLAWAAEPEHDERKLAGAKFLVVMSIVWMVAIYYKRWKWAPIKSRKIVLDAVN